jgi:hypothetical protein
MAMQLDGPGGMFKRRHVNSAGIQFLRQELFDQESVSGNPFCVFLVLPAKKVRILVTKSQNR